jgi:class 3 adenylate cyclase/tetratricopeptide (TPR) repeat protein
VICSNCGTENRAGARFCVACATPLARICPNCGAGNVAAARFCEQCATPLPDDAAVRPAAAAPAAPRDPAVAERRLVSVLFADLVGFTPFAEERDAEDVRDTLTRYFAIASDVVARYGGTVEKFIGDAVMAVWGAPTAQEDDAERAVRAALELVDSVGTLGPGISARAAVLTGEAAVTIGASNQGLVAGDLVNTAARLQSVAPPGSVLVGEGTHRAASRAIAFEPAGDQVLKGKTAPVAAWRALRVVAQRGGQGRSDLPEPPFVGRADELRTLREALAQSGREGRSRLVSVIGPAGIGKSRLAWELEKYADGVAEAVYWHRGRSPAYGEGIAFWALGEMVRRRAGLAEGDDEATTRERIASTVAEYIPDPADRRWVEPALLTLVGLEEPPPGGRDVMFAAWRIFFERIAARGTTVLLFEDLHWADSGLLDFIDHLLEWSRTSPLLVVTLARPELFDRRPDWGASRRAYTAMTLEPLAESAMRELLAGFVPGLPDAAVSAILARADGIPLYAVETVRALVAEGRLVADEGVYRPTADVTEIAIPETLRSLIASRLDALDPADRSLIQDASVLGQTFTREGLAMITGGAESDLDPRLRALVRREVLEVEADPRSPERGQYRFVQSLIREVAYGTMSRRERHRRHLAAARQLESLGDEELAGALASHYLAAYETAADGAERDAAAIQARIALRAAAVRAAGLGGHDQAIASLERALAITPDAAERAELLLLAGRSASTAGDHPRAETFLADAIASFRQAGDPAGAARASADVGGAVLFGGELVRGHLMLADALERLPADAPDDVRASLLSTLSRALMRLGRNVEAVAAADRALSIAEPGNLEESITEALINKGSALGNLGRWRESEALLERAIALASTGGFVASELRARSNVASMSYYNDPAAADRIHRGNLELSRRLGNRTMFVWISAQLSANLMFVGHDWDEALDIAHQGLAEARAISDRRVLTWMRTMVLLNRGESADEELRFLAEAVADTDDATIEAEAIAPRAMSADLAGRHGEALELWLAAARDESLAVIFLANAARSAALAGQQAPLAELIDRLGRQARARTKLPSTELLVLGAMQSALEGRSADAARAFTEGWRRFRELGVDFAFARSVVDAAVLLGPDDPAVAAALPDARTILERLGARPHLERLTAAAARAGSGRRTVDDRASVAADHVARPRA